MSKRAHLARESDSETITAFCGMIRTHEKWGRATDPDSKPTVCGNCDRYALKRRGPYDLTFFDGEWHYQIRMVQWTLSNNVTSSSYLNYTYAQPTVTMTTWTYGTAA